MAMSWHNVVVRTRSTSQVVAVTPHTGPVLDATGNPTLSHPARHNEALTYALHLLEDILRPGEHGSVRCNCHSMGFEVARAADGALSHTRSFSPERSAHIAKPSISTSVREPAGPGPRCRPCGR